MTAGGFRILDVHHHVGDPVQALAMPGAEGAAPPIGLDHELSVRLETMDRDGVDCALLIPGHSYLRPNGLADTRRINDGIAAYRDKTPDRFPAALGIVEPLYGRAGDEELRRIKGELGIVGVSFHTRVSGGDDRQPARCSRRSSSWASSDWCRSCTPSPNRRRRRCGESTGWQRLFRT